MIQLPAELSKELEDRKYLSAGQMTKLLKVSRTTIHKLAHRKINPLPSVLLTGRSRRFPTDKVLAWMKELGV